MSGVYEPAPRNRSGRRGRKGGDFRERQRSVRADDANVAIDDFEIRDCGLELVGGEFLQRPNKLLRRTSRHDRADRD